MSQEQEEQEIQFKPNQPERIRNLILSKKGQKLGSQLTRMVAVIEGKIKQTSGGGGCGGGKKNREYLGITKSTQQTKEKFKNEWISDAQHKQFRYLIEFSNRKPVHVYVTDQKEADQFENLLDIDVGRMVKNKSIRQQEVKGQYQKNGYQVCDDAIFVRSIFQKKPDQNQHQNQNIDWAQPEQKDLNNMYTSVIKKNYNHNQSQFKILQGQLGDTQYTDKDFPPQMSSISDQPQNFPISKEVQWKRATEFMQGNIQVFEQKIEPKDILQGGLGDCYYLCSLSALAERPKLIKKLFETEQFQKNALYCVWLCIDGEFKQIILDDYFPVVQRGGNFKPAFSSANGNELWVLLMEKAYAKCFGNYHRIEAGLTGLALRDLTGAPHEWISTKDGVNQVWDFIDYHDDEAQGHIMTAGTQVNPNGRELDMGEGIVSGHAYAILNHQVVNAGRGTERIIQLRNPWGKNEWTGRWSDQSNAWTPQIKQQCGVKDEEMKNDGIFWIEINDFCRKFSEVTTNMLNENYVYSSQKINMTQTSKVLVKFYVKEKTKGYIQLSQKDKRHFGVHQQYNYSYMRMIICKSDFSEYIGDDFSDYRDFYINGEYSPGEYYAYIEVDWSKNKQDANSLVISSYTEKQVQFDENFVIHNIDDTLDEMLLMKTPENPQKIKSYPDDPKITKYMGVAGGYVYFRYINQSEESTLRETIKLPNHQYLEICRPYTNSDQFQVEVKPNSVKIVKFFISSEGQGSYSLSLRSSFAISLGKQNLILKIKQNQPKRRKVGGSEVNVLVYTHFAGDKLYLFYENLENRVYKEDITLKLNNLKVEPNGINQLSITLKPKDTKIIEMSVVDTTQQVGFATNMLCQFQ